MSLVVVYFSIILPKNLIHLTCLNTKITYHFFYQVFYNKTLLICPQVRNPHPAIFQFIMDNKHVSFEETEEGYSKI